MYGLKIKPSKIKLKTAEDKTQATGYRSLQRCCICFLYPECPLSIKYTKTLNELHERFSEEQILFVGIIPGTDYTKATIEQFKKRIV